MKKSTPATLRATEPVLRAITPEPAPKKEWSSPYLRYVLSGKTRSAAGEKVVSLFQQTIQKPLQSLRPFVSKIADAAVAEREWFVNYE